jgi:predicted molibdopterin-dependent oxidoreductase YjgC
MFQRLPDPDRNDISMSFDGVTINAKSGDSVAAALLAAGRLQCRRSPVSEAPRGPYCLMGVCFECLVIIDGSASQQACMVEARDGMRIETQQGKRGIR